MNPIRFPGISVPGYRLSRAFETRRALNSKHLKLR